MSDGLVRKYYNILNRTTITIPSGVEAIIYGIFEEEGLNE
jgi:hypothetical protein